MSGELSPLARFRTLRDLDLDLFRTAEIGGRHTESSGSHLLDLGVSDRAETAFVFTALPAVGLGADAVHRFRDALVRLGRNRSQTHRGTGEPFEDSLFRLHFLDRYRLAIAFEFEEIPNHLLVAVFDDLFQFFVILPSTRDGGVSELSDRVGCEIVVLLTVDVFVETTHVQRKEFSQMLVNEGFPMVPVDARFDIAVSQARHKDVRVAKTVFDDIFRKSEYVEKRGIPVRCDRGDPHFRHDLQDARTQCAVHLFEFVAHLVFGHRFFCKKLIDRGVEHVRIDGRGAVRQQAGRGMGIDHFARDRDDADEVADSRIQQRVVQTPDRHRHRDRFVVFVEAVVIENDDADAVVLDILDDVVNEIFEAPLQILLVGRTVGSVFVVGSEPGMVLVAETFENFEFFARENRRGGFETLRMVGIFVENVVDLPESRIDAHDDLFTNRIDRRVRDLGEFLLEEIGEAALHFRKGGHRRIVAHRSCRLFAILDHRFDDLIDHLLGDVEIALLFRQLFEVVSLQIVVRFLDKLLQIDHLLVEPLGVGLRVFEIFVDFVVFENRTVFEIETDHLTGLQAPPFEDVFVGDIDDAVFARYDQTPIFGHDIFGRSQTVTVQHTSDITPVGETYGRRTVPRFEAGAHIFVESTQVGVHMRRILPGGGYDRPDRLEHIHAVDTEKFEEIVETGTVARTFLKQREESLKLFVTENRRFDRFALRFHIETVGLDRVDFTVVGDHSEGLCEAPLRKRVGGEALVKECETDLEVGIVQIGIELLDMSRHHQTLVADDPV